MFHIFSVQIFILVERSVENILRIISKAFAVWEASVQKIPAGDPLTCLFLKRNKIKWILQNKTYQQSPCEAGTGKKCT